MRCWSRYLLWSVIVLLGASILLSACGQKGDLYLPETKQPQGENKPAG